MSEENKALARRYFEEIWDKGNIDAADEFFTTDFVRHGPAAIEGEVRGLDAFKQLVTLYRTAFPDFRVPIEDLVAEGDRVVVRWSARGTHQGELMGNAPSGNRVAVPGILIDRFSSGGKIEEQWIDYDTLGFMQQIRAIPQPE